MEPSFASKSIVDLFQNERRVPVSFSFPIVWSAPLREKKLESPEKNAPLTGNRSSLAAVSSDDWNEAGALAGGASHEEPDTGALHHASLVPPAPDAISAVSAGAASVSGAASGQIGFSSATGAASARASFSSCGQTGADHAASSAGGDCSCSTVSFCGWDCSLGSFTSLGM